MNKGNLILSTLALICCQSNADTKNIHLKADSISYQHQEQQSVYTGHVEVELNDFTIHADKMLIRHPEEKEKQQLEIQGNPAFLSVKQNNRQHLQSKKMSLYPSQGLVVLRDHVELTTGFEQLHSKTLRYHFTSEG